MESAGQARMIEAERRARAAAAWSALDEAEQRGITYAVRVKMATMCPGDPQKRLPNLFHDQCQAMALELQEAAEDLAKWNRIPVAEREAAEQLAVEEWPLFMQGKRKLWACWMALQIVHRRPKGAEAPTRTEPP
jgi:hypothetical protein